MGKSVSPLRLTLEDCLQPASGWVRSPRSAAADPQRPSLPPPPVPLGPHCASCLQAVARATSAECSNCIDPNAACRRLIDHVNGHRDGLGADLWAEVVMQAGPDALDASWGACVLLVPNTAHGRRKHLDACVACTEEVAGAVRREPGGIDSAFGALAGLTRSRSVLPWPTRT
jgi:hypothetical protein